MLLWHLVLEKFIKQQFCAIEILGADWFNFLEKMLSITSQRLKIIEKFEHYIKLDDTETFSFLMTLKLCAFKCQGCRVLNNIETLFKTLKKEL